MIKTALKIGLSILPKRYRTADWLLVTTRKRKNKKTGKPETKSKVVGGSDLKKMMELQATGINKKGGGKLTAKVVKNTKKLGSRKEFDAIYGKSTGTDLMKGTQVKSSSDFMKLKGKNDKTFKYN